MRTLTKLSGFAGVAGLSAMLLLPVAPAQAQISPQGSNALLGAGIGAIAGGLLGHGNVGPVLGGAAVGAAIGALATPNDRYAGYYNGYGYPYATQYGYAYDNPYYPYTSNYYPYGYGSYPYTNYGYYGAYGY